MVWKLLDQHFAHFLHVDVQSGRAFEVFTGEVVYTRQKALGHIAEDNELVCVLRHLQASQAYSVHTYVCSRESMKGATQKSASLNQGVRLFC